jgi:hypothetical protein
MRILIPKHELKVTVLPERDEKITQNDKTCLQHENDTENSFIEMSLFLSFFFLSLSRK